MPRQIIGLDIGQTAVRGAQVRYQRGQATVVQYHEVPLPRGVISQGDVHDVSTLTAALKQLHDEGEFTARQARLAIGNRHVYVREHTVQRVPLDMLKDSLRYQIDDLLPIDPDKAMLDFFPTSQSVTAGQPTYTGLLVAAETEPLEQVADAIRKAKMQLVGVDLTALALVRAFDPRRAEANSTTSGSGSAIERVVTDLIIDFGAGTTQIVAARGARPLAVRMLPTGGDDITEVIAGAEDMPFEEAEQFKHTRGYLGTAASTPTEMSLVAVTDRLLTSIGDTISFFRNTTAGLENVDRVTITGGGSRMPGLQQQLVNMLGLPVYLGEPLKGVTFESAEVESRAYDHLPTTAVAIGCTEV